MIDVVNGKVLELSICMYGIENGRLAQPSHGAQSLKCKALSQSPPSPGRIHLRGSIKDPATEPGHGGSPNLLPVLPPVHLINDKCRGSDHERRHDSWWSRPSHWRIVPERLGSYPFNDGVGIRGRSPRSPLATSVGIDDQPICVNIAEPGILERPARPP